MERISEQIPLKLLEECCLQWLKPAEHASYNTRLGAEGYEPHGCFDNTRVHILEELEDWAQDPWAPKVYWLNGHLGTGKSTIAHTFSEHLAKKQLLGASVFCSRSGLRDVHRIIPTIASMLSGSMPNIRSAICEAIQSDPAAPDLNSLSEQFEFLVVGLIKNSVGNDMNGQKIVVIDGFDECFSVDAYTTRRTLESLITTILDGVADIPLKFLLLSRSEDWIKKAFRDGDPSSLRVFSLHDVAKSDVQHDIEVYLKSRLSEIGNRHPQWDSGWPPEEELTTLLEISRGYSKQNSRWPPEEELTTLITLSDGLFIYAATAVRYIGAPNIDSRFRLTRIVRPGRASVLQGNMIDSLYGMVMDQAFDGLEDEERFSRREVLASVVLFQTPLSMAGIASLLDIPIDQVKLDLSPFHSVLHIPSSNPGHVAIGHDSFREFLFDPARCGDRHRVDGSQGHYMLTIKCLQSLNRSLLRNICDSPEDMIGPDPHAIDCRVIPEAVRYSRLYCSFHLAATLADPPADIGFALEGLHTLADDHILHCFESPNSFGELESCLGSISRAVEAISLSISCREMFKPIDSAEVLQ